MPRRSPFDTLAERFAQVVADRLVPLMARAATPLMAQAAGPRRGPGRPPGRRGPSKLKGRRLDMRCRYPGCKNKSKGPRFRFLCDQHLKLPKAKQNAALEKWAKKNA